MHYHSNHCWCNNSNWDNEDFSARYMVSIEHQLSEVDYDKWNETDVDWDELIIMDRAIDTEQREMYVGMKADRENDDEDTSELKKLYVSWTDEQLDEMSMRDYPSLRPEIIKWLEDNIEPPKSKADFKCQPQGWAMGNVDYRLRSHFSVTLWFYRRNDAMKFIKEWSAYKKPTTYFDYFKEIYKILDFKTGKLVKREDE